MDGMRANWRCGEPVLECHFGANDLTRVRHALSAAAGDAGLSGSALEDFVLAVNEVTTNAVVHGGGTGLLRLWHCDAGVRCEVTDTGTGLDEQVLAGPRPPAHAVRGRGLWLATQLCQVTVYSRPQGTTIRVTFPF
jgi:anti-sigma regulatory factor (Ser/Thr protein kinase)